MSKELGYVLITPYTLRKSRTGGVLGRLLCTTGLDLVAARMFGPSSELVKRHAGLNAEVVVVIPEYGICESRPFLIRTALPHFFKVLAVEKMPKAVAINHFHLDIAYAVTFLVDFPRNEIGALNQLQFRYLRRDSPHVGPVFLCVGVNGRVKELDCMPCDTTACALSEAQEDNSLAATA